MLLEYKSILPIASFNISNIQQAPCGKPRGLWLNPLKEIEYSKSLSEFTSSQKRQSYIRYIFDIPERSIALLGEQKQESILKINISQKELQQVINLYQVPGYDYEIDWNKLSKDYSGVYFYETNNTYNYFSESTDGSWILSIHKDQVCLWNQDFINKHFALYL